VDSSSVAASGGSAEVEANARLDNLSNKSHKGFLERAQEDVLNVKVRARKSLAWAKAHVLVDQNGELLCDQDGNVLTLGDMSRSWYSQKGAKNNTKSVARRLFRAADYPADFLKLLPKFITLTFRDIEESWQAERAIQKLMNALRTWASRRGFEIAYFWVAEVQQRGALHYHILVLGCPYLPKSLLQSWWPYGFVEIRRAGDIVGGLRYLAKYLWKSCKLVGESFEDLPLWWFLFSVFRKRRYGFSKYFTLPPIERVPRWLRDFLVEREAGDMLTMAKRVAGGGWLIALRFPDKIVRLLVPCPYRVVERVSCS